MEKIKFSEWLELWMKKEKPFLKESTYATYTNIIENHIKTSLGQKKLDEITSSDLQSLIFEKLTSGRLDRKGSLARKSVKDIISIIKSSLNYAMKENIIKEKLLVCKFPTNEKLENIKIFTSEEQKSLFNYITLNLNKKNLGLLICLNLGLRLGEICGLKWKDINLNEEVLTINHTIQRIYLKEKNFKGTKIIISTPKTKSSHRTIPLGKELVNMMKKFKINDENYLLSGKEKYIEPCTYRRYYYKILECLKISKLKFHSLRHTFSTKSIELGVDYKTVSEILGHSSINTTLNLYVHPHTEYKKKCIEAVFKNLKNNKKF
jgi:site-specific recombinase, phage integrase family